LFNFVYCSIIGAIFIVFGLYSVVWGKAKDEVISVEEKIGMQELPITNTSTKVEGGGITSEVNEGVTNNTQV